MLQQQEYPISEAKAHFSSLIDEVLAGKSFTITRHGEQVAKLVPAHPVFNRQAAEAAYKRMRARAAALQDQTPFNWEEWKAYRDEGRS